MSDNCVVSIQRWKLISSDTIIIYTRFRVLTQFLRRFSIFLIDRISYRLIMDLHQEEKVLGNFDYIKKRFDLCDVAVGNCM